MSRAGLCQFDLFANSLAPIVQATLAANADLAGTDDLPPSLPDNPMHDAVPAGRNFRLVGSRALAATWKGRAHDNLAAIRLLQRIEAEERPATSAEQAELVKFSAFSSSELSQNAFRRRGEPTKKGWETIASDLETLVSAEEMAGLMRATQYAHFTPEFIIRAMWSAVEGFGFDGGKVLEPGCGTGLFLAAAPEAYADQVNFCGVEADPITARIAALLYPQSDIRHGDFAKVHLGAEFDLAIGNPPFSERTIRFTDVQPAVPLSLHDFFIARSLYNLRPGGIGAFVVSRWTMDKMDKTARNLIADICDLIGAIRLPERALRKDAGTDVVVDLLFFRRRLAHEGRGAVHWIDVGEAVAAEGENPALCVNRYFLDHPEMVLGRHERTSSQHGPTYTCAGEIGEELADQLMQAMSALPRGIYQAAGLAGAHLPAEERAPTFFRNNAEGATIREGSYLIQNGTLHQVEDGHPKPISVKAGHTQGDGISKRAVKIITALLPVRDATRAILRAQEANLPWEDDQIALRNAYRDFVAKFGHINKAVITSVHNKETGKWSEYVRRPNLSPFMDDPDVWLVASIEDYDEETDTAQEGAIFSLRVVNAPATRAIITPADALSVCLHDVGHVDLDFIAETLGASRSDVEAALAGSIYLNPENGRWETADKYLSGPVRTKLAAALTAAEADNRFTPNVAALQGAQPVDLKPSEISARLGSPWIPASDIERFVKEVLKVKTTIHHLAALGSWSVGQNRFSLDAGSSTEWGTVRRHAGLLLEDALNASIPQIFDVIREGGKETRVLNAAETEAAKEKLSKLKLAFQNWIWTDAERAERLCNFYNATMNNLVPRKFDGSHLTLPGTSNVIQFYPHQKRGIWRAICDGSMYVAHAVGAGKTFTMAAAIMEQKRLGLITKALMVVPSHCLAQASREFVLLYPNARILVADESNFVKAKRQRFIARAATGNWDCIIITHSAFKFIAVPAAFERDLLQAQIDEFEEMLDDVDANDRVSRKQIERQKERFSVQLEALKSHKDDLLTLSEIGVDQIVVDEAQEFRKLSFATNQTSLLGVDPQGSQRAWDLYVKTQLIEEKNPGRALIMASGTPITNTMGELYTLQRFFAPELLRRLGLQAFDAWALNFGEVRTELELQPSGTYKPVARFCEFVNVPELIDIFRHFADIVQKDDIREHVKIPPVSGGRRQVVTADATLMFKGYQRALDRRIKAIKARSGQAHKGDDILLSVINDGRHAAIDLRLIDPTLPNDPNSKLNVMIENVWRVYRETTENVYFASPGVPHGKKGASQLIFSDIGTLQAEEKRGFSAYAWIKARLIELGIPEDEIAIIHHYPKTSDKLRLFTELKTGSKRICIGSTKKMGTWMNAQLRMAAIHHLDVPWLPSDVEQRDGRGERQGNQNAEIQIYCYATLTSMDGPMWGVVTRKQNFISAAMSGDRSVRRLEDAGSQENQFALAKAIASGDQRLMSKAGLEAEIARLWRLKDAHIDSQVSVARTIASAREQIAHYLHQIEGTTADLSILKDTSGDKFRMTFNDTAYTERTKAGAALIHALFASGFSRGRDNSGTLGGFPFDMAVEFGRSGGKKVSARITVIRNNGYNTELEFGDEITALGLISRLERAVSKIAEELPLLNAGLQNAQSRLADFEPRLGVAFDMDSELHAKMTELRALEVDLAETSDGKEGKFDELDVIANLFAGRHVPYVEPPADNDAAGGDAEVDSGLAKAA